MVAINQIHAPPERKIDSIANALAMGASIEDVRKQLLAEGYSEYGIFLTVKAAETTNIMREREYPCTD